MPFMGMRAESTAIAFTTSTSLQQAGAMRVDRVGAVVEEDSYVASSVPASFGSVGLRTKTKRRLPAPFFCGRPYA
jgi:hypothetical protein